MIIDTNAYLGHFAFRQLRHNTADGLLKLMDAKGIDRAMVSSAAAITYRNTQAGNEEVARDTATHRDRLIPLAVINPFYAGWEDDLKICHEQFGMKGLRLYPKWHNYELADDVCHEMIEQATDRAMLVSIPLRAVDVRQMSWLVDVPDVTLEEVAELVKDFPRARFVLLNVRRIESSPFGQKDGGLGANTWIEISRLRALLDNPIGQMLSYPGADRVVFGSGIPFKYADPALLKLEVLDATEDVKERIRWKNAAALLRS